MPEATPQLTITLRQRRLILTGVLIGMLVAAINQTTVTTVLPTIARELHGLNLYTWVFTASMLASSVAVPIFGKLSDMYGRRKLFISGVSIFLTGAIGCAVAQSMEQLIAARAIQGIGMGAIMPLAMAILADVVPANDRGKWQGVMGGVFGLAMVMGPLAGGAISDAFGWRWIFWANVPLGAIALFTIITQMHLPFVPRKAKIDWLGAVTFASGLSLLLLALSQGGSKYPWDSTRIIGMLVGAAALLIAFVIAERHAEDPMIPLELLADRNIAATSVAGLFIGAGMFAAIFYVPLFMQAVVGVSSSESGLALIPLMLGLIITSTSSGILISKTGKYKLITAAGPLIAALGLFLMSNLEAGVSTPDVAWRTFITGLGIGLTMQNLLLIAQNSVDLKHTGVATSLATLVRSVGGTIGIAILGTVLANRLPINIGERFEPIGGSAALAKVGELDSETILNASRSSLPGPVKEALRLAVSDTLVDLFLLGVPFLLAAFLATLVLRADKLSDKSAIGITEELEHELADLVPVDPAHIAAPRA